MANLVVAVNGIFLDLVAYVRPRSTLTNCDQQRMTYESYNTKRFVRKSEQDSNVELKSDTTLKQSVSRQERRLCEGGGRK
jgi:hypothetical protein